MSYNRWNSAPGSDLPGRPAPQTARLLPVPWLGSLLDVEIPAQRVQVVVGQVLRVLRLLSPLQGSPAEPRHGGSPAQNMVQRLLEGTRRGACKCEWNALPTVGAKGFLTAVGFWL